MASTDTDRASIDDLLDAYRQIHRIRAFETTCLELSTSAHNLVAGSIHLCMGQEAIPIGALGALDERDAVFATYRGHGWALACGVPMYDLMSEVCHRADGVNGGRAGSALLTAPQYRFFGENSIVGAGAPIAAGMALAQAARGLGGVSLVSIGDGAMSQGALHEAMVFAVSRQLPVVFIVENNDWSEMTRTATLTPLDRLAKRAAGYGMRGVTIDGTDPFVVRQTVDMAVENARSGGGPVLLECRAPRLGGHYNRDIEHYRPKADRAEAAGRDPLIKLEARLAQLSVGAGQLAAIREANDDEIAQTVARVSACEPPSALSARDHITAASRINTLDASAAPSGATSMTYVQAVNEALRKDLGARPEVRVYGEDCGVAGGIFGATRNLQREFGAERVFDTPIAESAILGSAVGAAMAGLRPVVEIMWADFMLVALDQIINQAANVRYVSRGALNAPLVIRTQQGATPGSCAQHAQCLEALLAHIPGLKVGLPADARDAFEMLRAAVADPDPVVLIEARALYQMKADVDLDAPVQTVGGARWRLRGADLTVVTWGSGVPLAMAAADTLASEGLAVGVLDLRWVAPIDDGALAEAVADSGRILVVHEANLTGGLGAEIAARISAAHWGRLRAPVQRVGALDTRVPAAPTLQAAVLPSAADIAAAARALIAVQA